MDIIDILGASCMLSLFLWSTVRTVLHIWRASRFEKLLDEAFARMQSKINAHPDDGAVLSEARAEFNATYFKLRRQYGRDA